MSMHPAVDAAAEQAVWIAVAQAVAEGSAGVVLDDLKKRGLNRGWFGINEIGTVMSGAMVLHLQGKEVSLLGIMSQVNSGLDKEAWGKVTGLWHKAREMERVDASQYVASLKHYAMTRSVDGIMLDLRETRTQEKNPAKWLPHFIQRLHQAIRDGKDYDPTPSAIWKKGEPTRVIGSTGLKALDEAFRGGIRNGMLVVWVSPTKSGKSRMTYTMAANAVAQCYPVAVISTEARPFDVVAGTLQAYAGYDDYEIETKRGREEHRDVLMSDAVNRLDKHLYVWGVDMGTPEGIEEILYWVQPHHLILDHMMPMVVQSNDSKYTGRGQQIYDFSLFLEQAAARHRCTITVFAQLSGENANRLKKKGDLPDLPAFGSAGPGHSAHIGILSMRHPDKVNTMLGRVKLDRIKGLMDTEFELRHNAETHTFYEPYEGEYE